MAVCLQDINHEATKWANDNFTKQMLSFSLTMSGVYFIKSKNDKKQLLASPLLYTSPTNERTALQYKQ